MAPYRVGINQLDIKPHGIWASEAFWTYITLPCVSAFPIAAGLVEVMATTLQWGLRHFKGSSQPMDCHALSIDFLLFIFTVNVISLVVNTALTVNDLRGSLVQLIIIYRSNTLWIWIIWQKILTS